MNTGTSTAPASPVTVVSKKWTRPQKTAIGLAIAAPFVALIVAFVALGWIADKFLNELSDSSNYSGGRSIRQGICLTYDNFVLNQHHAGLSIAQIEAVIAHAGADSTGTGIEDPDLCGSPQAVLDAAGIH
ncbi:hypothetical protein GS538_09255 [Rhodococcus hoagii]|nr:hypothetical protein [Prescottella equi]